MGENEENGEGLIVTDGLLIRYLLGELPESERIQIQEQSFSDDDLFDRLLEAENDLIDRYARGELTTSDRVLFEKSLLPREAMSERIRFAAALAAATRSPRPAAERAVPAPAARPFPSPIRGAARYWLVAAASLVLMIGIVWMVTEILLRPSGQIAERNTTDQPAPETASRNQALHDNSNQNAERQQPPIGSASPRNSDQAAQKLESQRDRLGAVSSFVLLPGSIRSGEEPRKLVIGPAVRAVRLYIQLNEAEEYDSYDVALRTVSGREVFGNRGLASTRMPFGRAVAVDLSSKIIGAEQYEIELKGRAGTAPPAIVNYYYFTVADRR